MKAVIQRVSSASVEVNGQIISSIKTGILVLLGVEKTDTIEQARFIAEKISVLRIFEDENGKMNLSVKDIQGDILAVSQFTLAGSVKKGRRPSFDNAMVPENASTLFNNFTEFIEEQGLTVKKGVFQSFMQIHLCNDGPVTFVIEK